MFGEEGSGVIAERSSVDERLDKPVAIAGSIRKSPSKQPRQDRTKSKAATRLSLTIKNQSRAPPELIVTKCMEPIVETLSLLHLQPTDGNGCVTSVNPEVGGFPYAPEITEGQSTNSYTLVDISEVPTSDYDSCFETDQDVFSYTPPVVGCDMCGSGRDGDDADSGVIESGSGQVAIGNDFVVSDQILLFEQFQKYLLRLARNTCLLISPIATPIKHRHTSAADHASLCFLSHLMSDHTH